MYELHTKVKTLLRTGKVPEKVGYSSEDAAVEGDDAHVVHVRSEVECSYDVHYSKRNPEVYRL